ncbi:hypothetical protein AOQ84DRAFT_363586 [Glonium stellatum]|uniref:Uncharacterized protein n=1 Tax=Glonium stellatum TaxID=574774 RepID=A0A8E2F1Z7_9PEZI|nr:hypothetical protein AOQ84DRAFT_363586 [Glonium stellatum]
MKRSANIVVVLLSSSHNRLGSSGPSWDNFSLNIDVTDGKSLQGHHITPFYWILNQNDQAPHAGAPTVFAIMEGIRNVNLSLNYARWQYYRGTQGFSIPRPGPMLKLEYRISFTLGHMPSIVEETVGNLAQYRDPNSNGMNCWVVFHLHCDQADPSLFYTDPATGNIYIGSFSSAYTMAKPQVGEAKAMGCEWTTRARSQVSSTPDWPL